MKYMAIIILALGLAACASHASNIEPAYVSPTAYNGFSCDQLSDERQRIGARVASLSDKQDENADTDAVMTTVGVIVFWPALFALAATNDYEAELGRLKGEYDAVEAAYRTKGCAYSTATQVEAPAL